MPIWIDVYEATLPQLVGLFNQPIFSKYERQFSLELIGFHYATRTSSLPCGKIEWDKQEMRRHRNVFLYGPGSNSAEFNIWRLPGQAEEKLAPESGQWGPPGEVSHNLSWIPRHKRPRH